MNTKKGLLERLATGPVIGDGGYVFSLEKRGYVLAGAWTPEAVLEHPEAVRQLHREFLRAGSDVLQTATFYAQDGIVQCKVEGNHTTYSSQVLNEAACDLAFEVAADTTLICGSISQTLVYIRGEPKDVVQNEFRKQCHVFKGRKLDFLLAEFFSSIIEMEWALEVMKETGLTLCASMRIGLAGDTDNITPQECAVRMYRAGADVLGTNCAYDPNIALKTLAMMKDALNEEGVTPFLMCQPVGFHTSEIEHNNNGYTELPEFPFAMETRALNRIDAHRYAREAYELGVRYIGGCCGFEPYHIRALAEELAPERGYRPPGHDKSCVWGKDLLKSAVPSQTRRANKDYWLNLVPATGRENVKILGDVEQQQHSIRDSTTMDNDTINS